MKTFELKGELRENLGKKASKLSRREGEVPCVLYGGEKVVHFSVTQDGIRKLIYTPEIFLVNLNVNGKVCNAILKDLQFHPVSDKLLHVDFYEVSAQRPIVMEVPVVVEGLAEGVKAGGKLSLELRKLKVKGLYDKIPEKLVINVENLGLGKTVQVGQLSFDNLELMNAKNTVVCAIKLTRAARGAAEKGS
ncbi:MAG: 50S ribosomal protein L25/general stress protein Ctc [Candidatus Azobacteroides sp.]|nr:50S ribosomal protein L25/general stress protein Ctc [Candidatus Azobacteroides sp.]